MSDEIISTLANLTDWADSVGRGGSMLRDDGTDGRVYEVYIAPAADLGDREPDSGYVTERFYPAEYVQKLNEELPEAEYLGLSVHGYEYTDKQLTLDVFVPEGVSADE